MTRTRLALGLGLALLAFAAGAQTDALKPYIVQLVDAPVAAYSGGVPGYTATRPVPGTRLNVTAADVQAYTQYLEQKQSVVAPTLAPSMVTYRYKNVLNGFAALLTDAELARLVTDPGVKSLTADVAMPVHTTYTPTFLGINTGPNGVWTRIDTNARLIKGEDVIIAHLDGGVWPENPSFSDKVDAQGKPIASHLPGTLVYNPLPAGRYTGTCQPGLGFTAAHCNNKLIGARYFNAGWKASVAAGNTRTWSLEYLDSPRDPDGHGSHTLSTSGGNEMSPANVAGSSFNISGIAPRARVAAYKVCYTPADANDNPQNGSCFGSDSVAAADQAVADEVDVINFSVGGSTTSFNDAVETAFRNATLAGVFVAASAGNSNVFPGNASTVNHISPWLTTVGNSTHDRFTVATVTLGSGATASGPSFQTSGLESKPLILATDAGVNPYASLSDANKLALARCFNSADRASFGGDAAAALDPAKVAGKIVVCIRGGNPLVNKTQEIKDRGGAAAIIQNLPAGFLPAPLDAATADTTLNIAHAVPTAHLAAASASTVVLYAMGSGATASFGPGVQQAGVVAPVMSDSSSRGPNLADLNVLKPDITAPGTDIIAAYTNTAITPAQRLQIIAGTLIPGPGADMISGTSMASPHVAGAAALLRQANPTWTPFAIKSALMTSAQQTVKLANCAIDPGRFGFGAGHLNPNGALDTRVVYDQTNQDHVNYANRAIDGRQLNLASLTHASVVGVGTLTRSLTNKDNAPVTYNATADLPGFLVTVEPGVLTIPAGGSASYTVTMRRTAAAPIGQWSFGEVMWTGTGLPAVRSPLSANPSLLSVLSSTTDTRAAGTKIFSAAFGWDGSLFTSRLGLLPATIFQGFVATNQRQCHPFTVPAGAKVVRAQLFNADTQGAPTTDLDLIVLRGATTVGSSGRDGSDELVSVSNPTAADNYSACVDGFAVTGSAAYKLSLWVLGPANPGSLTAFGPSKVVIGGVASIGLGWNVAAGARYLGLVEFRDNAAAAPIGSTQVFIDTAAAGAATPVSAPVFRYRPPSIQ